MKQKSMEKIMKQWLPKFMVATIVLAVMGTQITVAQAAAVTQFSDIMSRQKASTASNHEIKFVTPSGVASGGIITLAFSAGFTGIGSMVGADFDFAQGSSGTCSSATFTEQSVVDSSPSTSQFSIHGVSQTVTITSGGGSATITAGRCVRLRAGTGLATDTTGSGPATHQISNGAIGSADTITIAGSFGDTGVDAVEILANDQITVSATVDPTITFTLSDSTPTDNAIGFGTLTTANARYATADSTGNTTDPAAGAAVAAITTNASGGYSLTYIGDTLKSGSDSISVATITADADGTPNSSQFATSYETNGSSTITTSYAKGSNNWDYLGSTTTSTEIVTRTTPTNTETIKMHYLANIAGTTPAGSYSTTITYIATGTF